MRTHDIIVVGASAGGVEALMALVADLPPNFPGALFVVLHISPNMPSRLADILSNVGPLPARSAEEGAPIEMGTITVALPDHHLLLTADRMHLSRGPRENRSRPAIDPLFRTAALAFGPRVVGIVLSGMLNDGTAGLIDIKQRGGLAIVQDPDTAIFPSMPLSACHYVQVDWCLAVPAIARKISQLAQEEVTTPKGDVPMSEDMEMEAQMAGLDPRVVDQDHRPGTLTELTCPECHGPIWQTQEGKLLRFRCRVGHAYTAETMLDSQSENMENTLWTAFNALEENAQLYEVMATMARTQQQTQQAEELSGKVSQLREHARQIRRMLMPA